MAEAGFRRSSAVTSAATFSRIWSALIEALPTAAWTTPAFSTRKSILPPLSSRTVSATDSGPTTVPTFGLGMSPRGPRTRPSLPTLPIMSRVATTLS